MFNNDDDYNDYDRVIVIIVIFSQILGTHLQDKYDRLMINLITSCIKYIV